MPYTPYPDLLLKHPWPLPLQWSKRPFTMFPLLSSEGPAGAARVLAAAHECRTAQFIAALFSGWRGQPGHCLWVSGYGIHQPICSALRSPKKGVVDLIDSCPVHPVNPITTTYLYTVYSLLIIQAFSSQCLSWCTGQQAAGCYEKDKRLSSSSNTTMGQEYRE